jgi:hypothetical protein
MKYAPVNIVAFILSAVLVCTVAYIGVQTDPHNDSDDYGQPISVDHGWPHNQSDEPQTDREYFGPEPTMLTVPEPDGWEWEPGDDVILDDNGEPIPILVSEPRSACWRKTRAEFLKTHPRCEFKGCKETKGIVPHHVIPFHVDKSLECKLSNLIAACWHHHIWAAHMGNYREHNRNVRADFAAGRYPIIGWERLLANREKHRRMRAKAAENKSK